MATLVKRMQAQSSYTHQSQQSLLLYGYKKIEVSPNVLGIRAFQVQFSNKLLSGQEKQSCRHLISFF